MAETMPASNGTSPSPSASQSPDLEALKGGIMAEIEAKLSTKENELWKKGQAEIKRLQQEQQQVKDCIGQLQDRQVSLLSENKQIRGALLEVTSRFELVVKEMREVLRALPQQQRASATANINSTLASAALQPSPSPSAASTSASEALRDELSPNDSFDTATLGSAERTGARTTPSTGVRLSPGDTGATFCTPPRNDTAAAQEASLDAGSAGSPAVLSLVKSLPPATTGTPSSSPATKLQLAECLAGEQATKSASLPAPPSPPALRQAEPATSTSAGPTPATPTNKVDFVTVEINKESGFVTLGIEVNQIDGSSLCVESIDEHGLVGRYNSRQDARSTSRVQVGDRVIEVNGISRDPNAMLMECKARQRLVFTIARDTFRKASDGEDAVVDEDVLAQKPASPVTSRMRPEASVFVPASQVSLEVQSTAPPLILPSVAVVPPGFESYDAAGLLTLPTGPALGTQFASMLEAAAGVGIHAPPVLPPVPMGMPLVTGSPGYDDEEEVKRALFP